MDGTTDEAELRRFTVDEVYRMVDVGILDADEHLELIDGELLEMMDAHDGAHVGLTSRIGRRLDAAFGPTWHVRHHSPVRLGCRDLPEPDLFVVRLPDLVDRLPEGEDVAHIVEICVSSQSRDLRKAPLYASAGIPVYWLVDVNARTCTIFEEPNLEGYVRTRTFADGESFIGPDDQPWTVASLLP